MSNKKMNFSAIKTQDTKTFTNRKIICDKYEVIIEETFRDSKIIDLMKYAIEKSSYIKENNLDIPMDSYIILVILKFFTDIEFPEDIQKQLQMFNAMFDLGYVTTILQSFKEGEVNRLLNKFSGNLQDTIKSLDIMLEEIEDKELESDDDEEIIETEGDTE